MFRLGEWGTRIRCGKYNEEYGSAAFGEVHGSQEIHALPKYDQLSNIQ